MGRPRTPTNVLELRGAYKRNPQRKPERELEGQPKLGIGPPPDYLLEDERSCWDELVTNSLPGSLGDSDRTHLEIAAKLLALTRRVKIEDVSDGKLSRLDSMLGKMGMNPSERSKIAVPKAKPKNAFSDL